MKFNVHIYIKIVFIGVRETVHNTYFDSDCACVYIECTMCFGKFVCKAARTHNMKSMLLDACKIDYLYLILDTDAGWWWTLLSKFLASIRPPSVPPALHAVVNGSHLIYHIAIQRHTYGIYYARLYVICSCSFWLPSHWMCNCKRDPNNATYYSQ